jgi:hypothetical protein
MGSAADTGKRPEQRCVIVRPLRRKGDGVVEHAKEHLIVFVKSLEKSSDRLPRILEAAPFHAAADVHENPEADWHPPGGKLFDGPLGVVLVHGELVA